MYRHNHYEWGCETLQGTLHPKIFSKSYKWGFDQSTFSVIRSLDFIFEKEFLKEICCGVAWGRKISLVGINVIAMSECLASIVTPEMDSLTLKTPRTIYYRGLALLLTLYLVNTNNNKNTKSSDILLMLNNCLLKEKYHMYK